MTVKKKRVVQPSKYKGGVQKVKTNSLYNKILGLSKTISPTVTFLMEDNSKTITPISKEFLHTDKGRRKSVGEIKNDLFALQHDYGAVEFSL